MDGTRQPKGWGKLFAALALIVAAFVVQVLALLVPSALLGSGAGVDADSPQLSLFMQGEVAGGVAALLFVALLGGAGLLASRPGALRFGMRTALAIFVVDVLLLALDAVGMAAGDGFELSETWATDTAVLAVLCLGVGLFEEGVFRGLLLNGLLARMGTSRRGVTAALVITSLLFGLSHVLPLSGELTAVTILQSVLKTLQSGILGFIFGVITLKTRSLWPSILVHALTDFILMVPSVGLMGTPLSTDYVYSGDDGIYIAAVYTVVCGLYLPALIRSSNEYRTMQGADRGAFWRARGAGADAAGAAAGVHVAAAPSAGAGAMPGASAATMPGAGAAPNPAPHAGARAETGLPVPPAGWGA